MLRPLSSRAGGVGRCVSSHCCLNLRNKANISDASCVILKTLLNLFPGGNMRFRIAILTGILLAFATVSGAAEETPLLAHAPTVSKTQIVFAYGGYLWSVPRDSGDARQLTTGGHERLPGFSPDGKWIAFTGQYDGNVDVFVMPAAGGRAGGWRWQYPPGRGVREG